VVQEGGEYWKTGQVRESDRRGVRCTAGAFARQLALV